jgi:hypothetical protein
MKDLLTVAQPAKGIPTSLEPLVSLPCRHKTLALASYIGRTSPRRIPPQLILFNNSLRVFRAI